MFEECCKLLYNEFGKVSDSILILSDNISVQNGSKTYVPFKNNNTFWENCGEDSIKMAQGKGRMDPLLKLYEGCRVMLPCNINVKEGKANGTQATLEKVILKHGELPGQVRIAANIPVPAVLASQVSYMVLRHSNERIQPPTFVVRPKQHSFEANVLLPKSLQVKENDREKLKMKATQVPVIVNNATTGHKLQGTGVDCLFVHKWSYVTNWVYVMLSRVRTHAGLYCRKTLSYDLSRYTVPQALKRMLRDFDNRSATYWSEEQYERLFTRRE